MLNFGDMSKRILQLGDYVTWKNGLVETRMLEDVFYEIELRDLGRVVEHNNVMVVFYTDRDGIARYRELGEDLCFATEGKSYYHERP